jgi:hypothetical protein
VTKKIIYNPLLEEGLQYINDDYIDENKSRVSVADTTPAFLESKIVSGTSITISKQNAGANENLKPEINSTLKSGYDTAVTNTHTHANKPALDLVSNTNTGDETKASIIGKIGDPKLYHGVVARPVGATCPIPSFITTTTFTLSCLLYPMQYYFMGKLVTVLTNKTATLSLGSGLYFVYFDGDTGNIVASKTFPGLTCSSNVTVAIIFWNGTDYGICFDERHSYERSCLDHIWMHDTVGVRYKSGITLTASGTGAAAVMATTQGEIRDEDIQFIVNARTNCRLFWQDSATTYTFNKVLSNIPFNAGPNFRPRYVTPNGAALVEATSAPNRYFNFFVYATSALDNPIFIFTETVSAATAAANGYTSVANARAIPFPNLSGFGLSPEMKPIYRLLVRADGVVQAIDLNLDDYRTVSSLPMAAGNTSTTASAVASSPSGTISATNVQSALDELDSEKENLSNKTNTAYGASAALYPTQGAVDARFKREYSWDLVLTSVYSWKVLKLPTWCLQSTTFLKVYKNWDGTTGTPVNIVAFYNSENIDKGTGTGNAKTIFFNGAADSDQYLCDRIILANTEAAGTYHVVYTEYQMPQKSFNLKMHFWDFDNNINYEFAASLNPPVLCTTKIPKIIENLLARFEYVSVDGIAYDNLLQATYTNCTYIRSSDSAYVTVKLYAYNMVEIPEFSIGEDLENRNLVVEVWHNNKSKQRRYNSGFGGGGLQKHVEHFSPRGYFTINMMNISLMTPEQANTAKHVITYRFRVRNTLTNEVSEWTKSEIVSTKKKYRDWYNNTRSAYRYNLVKMV